MIKLEHLVLPSPEQMEFVIEGMRNPMNSWDKSDSNHGFYIRRDFGDPCSWSRIDNPTKEDLRDECVEFIDGGFEMGDNDLSLMQKLSAAGTDHRKFMRMMPVMIRITAPLYWWKEFDTYKVGTVANSCSTMHKITEKEFTLEDFSCEHMTPSSLHILTHTIIDLNFWRGAFLIDDDAERESYITSRFEPDYAGRDYLKKTCWWQLIQLLPSSYNQTRNVMLNYEVLANIYSSRKNHKLDEWVKFCKCIEGLPYSELITQ